MYLPVKANSLDDLTRQLGRLAREGWKPLGGHTATKVERGGARESATIYEVVVHKD